GEGHAGGGRGRAVRRLPVRRLSKEERSQEGKDACSDHGLSPAQDAVTACTESAGADAGPRHQREAGWARTMFPLVRVIIGVRERSTLPFSTETRLLPKDGLARVV